MEAKAVTKSRWLDRLEKGEYMYQDLVEILFFYSKQVVGKHINRRGESLSVVIAELDRMDSIVRESRKRKSRWSANECSYNELLEILSEYHKEVHGTPLRMDGQPLETVIAELDALDAYTNVII